MREVFSIGRVAWLCGALACGLVAGWLSAGVASEILAAWVQAVFSVVAIFASSALWHADRSKQARERAIQAAALDLQAAVSQLEGLTRARNFFSQLKATGIEAEKRVLPDGKALFDARVATSVQNFARGLPNCTAGCSAGLEADALAFAAWVVRYTHELAECLEHVSDPVSGVVECFVDMKKWPKAAGYVEQILETADRLLSRLDRALSHPPGPKKK